MTVRRAQAADAPRIAEIYAHYVTTTVVTFDETPPSDDEMAAKIAHLTAAELSFVVLETEGTIDGFGYLAPFRPRHADRFTVEDSVYVAPEARGRGHGRALLERLLADAQQSGLREVIAVIAVTDDPSSVALHRSCGFNEAGTLTGVGFKHHRWLDTLFMQRSMSR